MKYKTSSWTIWTHKLLLLIFWQDRQSVICKRYHKRVQSCLEIIFHFNIWYGVTFCSLRSTAQELQNLVAHPRSTKEIVGAQRAPNLIWSQQWALCRHDTPLDALETWSQNTIRFNFGLGCVFGWGWVFMSGAWGASFPRETSTHSPQWRQFWGSYNKCLNIFSALLWSDIY